MLKTAPSFRSLFLTALVTPLLIGSVSAQVAVTGSASGFVNLNGTTQFTIPYQVTNPNSVLLVGTYVDIDGGTLSSLSFGSQSSSQLANQIINSQRTSLGYFLNPSTSADLLLQGVTNGGTHPTAGYFILELSGVNLSAPIESATGTSGSTAILTTAPNSLIADFFTLNNGGVGSLPDADSILTKLGEIDLNSGIGGGYIAVGTATPATDGFHNLGWAPTGGFQYGEVALAFTPVPEPGTALTLLGAAGTLACLRRRRA